MVQGNGTDETTVRTVITVVTHAKDVALRDNYFAFTAVIHSSVYIRFIERLTVAPNFAVVKGECIAAATDDSFNPYITSLHVFIKKGQIVVQRFDCVVHPGAVVENSAVDNYDIAVIRFAAQNMIPFFDDQILAVMQGGHHGFAGHSCRLDHKNMNNHGNISDSP